jgi:hypothetical protein
VRAERRAGCRNKRFSRRARSASGVTPFVSGGKRGFSPESGERPADSFWQQLDGRPFDYTSFVDDYLSRPKSAAAVLEAFRSTAIWTTVLEADNDPRVRAVRDRLRSHVTAVDATDGTSDAEPSLEGWERALNDFGQVAAGVAECTAPYILPMPLPIINALAVEAENGDQLCLIGMQLNSYIGAVAESIAETTINAATPPDAEKALSVLIAAAAFLAGRQEDWIYDNFENVGNSAPERTAVALLFQTGLLMFVLSHEIAHHALGHTGESHVIDTPGAMKLRLLERSRIQELQADRFGYEIFLNIVRGRLMPGVAVADQIECAPLVFFCALDLTEHLSDEKIDESESTHPLGMSRYLALFPVFEATAHELAREYLPLVEQIFDVAVGVVEQEKRERNRV